MTDFRIHKFQDGQEAYTSGNVSVSIGGQVPVEIVQQDHPSEVVEQFFQDPTKFTVTQSNQITPAPETPEEK